MAGANGAPVFLASMDYEDDYSIDQQFGNWLKDIRIKKGFRLYEAAYDSNIPMERLQDLEDGVADRGITAREIDLLSKLYNIDPRAIHKRAISGDRD